jgi:hypothetical protein
MLSTGRSGVAKREPAPSLLRRGGDAVPCRRREERRGAGAGEAEKLAMMVENKLRLQSNALIDHMASRDQVKASRLYNSLLSRQKGVYER